MKVCWLVLITAFLYAGAQAQCTQGQDGSGSNGENGSGQNETPQGGADGYYDPGALDTIEGKLLKTDTVNLPEGESGLHMTISSEEQDSLMIILGPQSFLESINFAISPGDSVQVTGSRLEVEGNQVIIASQIKSGDNTWTLRDENGVPLWSKELPQ